MVTDLAGEDVWEVVHDLDLPLLLVELEHYTVTAATPSLFRDLGLDPGNVLGHPIFNLFDDSDHERSKLALQAIAKGLVDFYRTHRRLRTTNGAGLEVSAWVRALDFGERRLALAEYSTSLTPGDSPLVEHLGYSPLLMALGIKVALDDFGAGYGGFAYLKRLPVSYLKIDREFVNDLVDEISSQHVVSAVVNLAKAFGMLTIAEGAEDEATVRLLQELGVDHVQGFVVGRPLPMSAAFGTTGFSGRA